jgi:hypothetical protein
MIEREGVLGTAEHVNDSTFGGGPFLVSLPKPHTLRYQSDERLVFTLDFLGVSMVVYAGELVSMLQLPAPSDCLHYMHI